MTSQRAVDSLLELLAATSEIRPVLLTEGAAFSGSAGTDVVFGDDEADTIAGANGRDLLSGGEGADTLRGARGRDLLFGGADDDVLLGGQGADTLYGGSGTDQLDGGGGFDLLDGGARTDALLGAGGDDQLLGGAGVDTLTGGLGIDQFTYEGNPFANGQPELVATVNINVLNTPDIITDYTIAEDQFALNSVDLGIEELIFTSSQASLLGSDANVIVLLDSFAAAGAAARAIANNENIESKEGVFVYFNTTLGLTRAVYSADLANGGDISVLANLDNQRNSAGIANLSSFSANNFTLV